MRASISLLLALSSGLAACGPDEPAAAPAQGSECGSAPGEAVPNEGWEHVPTGTVISWAHDPPASGPHWPRWAAYRAYDQPVPRGMWVHDLEHGSGPEGTECAQGVEP